MLSQSFTGQSKSRGWYSPYILLPLSFTENIWCSLCCQFSAFSVLLSHLTWHDSATLQWSQNIIYDNLTRLNTQKLSLSISKAYVPKEAWVFSNPAHLTNTCKHFHKARFPLRLRDFQDHLLLIHVDRLEQRISGLQSSCEGFNYLCFLPTLAQGSPGLSFMSSFGCGFHFAFHFFWTILFQKQGWKNRTRKRRKRKEEEPGCLWGEANSHPDPLQRESGKLTFSVLQLLRPRLFTTATFPSSTCCSLRSCSFICRASWIALVTASWSFK